MLPDWPPGTVAVLTTHGADPHAIPVSTGVRRGPTTILFALSLRRESLARLRADPRCALTIVAGGDVAVTAHGLFFVATFALPETRGRRLDRI